MSEVYFSVGKMGYSRVCFTRESAASFLQAQDEYTNNMGFRAVKSSTIPYDHAETAAYFCEAYARGTITDGEIQVLLTSLSTTVVAMKRSTQQTIDQKLLGA